MGRPVCKHVKISTLDKVCKQEVLIESAWPGCMKSIINGKTYFNKYWNKNGHFRMFDLATKIINKNYFSIKIHGRIDDVVNIRGHRIGSEEVESVILSNNKVTECAAISINDRLEGSVFCVFLVSKTKINFSINKILINHFGLWAIPKKIYYLKELPKTRSGKILRRLLRNVLQNEAIQKQTFSTMVNPNIVLDIIKSVKNEKNSR